MGIQLVGATKRMIFAIWDISEGAGTALPNSPSCQRFTGEGTGATCGGNYDWIAGREYRLRLWAAGSNSTGENWVAAIYDTQTQQESQIGLIYLKNTGGFIGYGWLRNSASIFLEYFGGEDSCANQPFSKVTWRGPYANDGAYVAHRAVVPFYPSCSTNNVVSSGRPRVTHEAGDGTQTTTPPSSLVWDFLSAGMMKVEVTNDDDDTLHIDLFVDGVTYSVMDLSSGTMAVLGDFTMSPGEHEAVVNWIDPDTQTQYSERETTQVTAGKASAIIFYLTPHIGLIQTSLSISFNPQTVDIGTNPPGTVTITVVLNPAISGKTISVYQSKGSAIGPWVLISSGQTDNSGQYILAWQPAETGTYFLKAEFSGDTSHSPSTAVSEPNALVVIPEFSDPTTPWMIAAVLMLTICVSHSRSGRKRLGK